MINIKTIGKRRKIVIDVDLYPNDSEYITTIIDTYERIINALEETETKKLERRVYGNK